MVDLIENQHVLRTTSAEEVRQELDARGISRVFLLTGDRSYTSSGAEAFFDVALKDGKIERFHSFSPNPSESDLKCGLEKFSAFGPDCLIAVGGGSVMDMAKLINFFGTSRVSVSGYLSGEGSLHSIKTLPLLAVPTTAGSGSEATRFAVLYREGEKYSVQHQEMIPDVVVLNPDFTESLPSYPTACSGFDALAQAIESYWAPGANSVSRHYSEEAIRLCLKHLEGAVLTPSLAHRQGMMDAAYSAGRAINITKTTAAHALAYFLTSHYGLPHGHAVAMVFSAVFEFNTQAEGFVSVDAVTNDLCRLLNCSCSGEAVEKISALLERIGLNRSWMIREGVHVDQMCSGLIQEVNRDRLRNNPRKLNDADLHRIVRRSFCESS